MQEAAMNTQTKANNRVKTAIPALAAVVLVLAGCSNAAGGGDGSGTASVSGFARGVITAKGSIFVNGIEYETSSSTVTVDNVSGNDDNLAIGMIVDVKGTINPDTGMGVANEVSYSTSIEGTVDASSIDDVSGTFDVFGQTIQTDASTVFEGVSGLTGATVLADGDRVEISGMKSGSVILAARVEANTDVGDYKAHGMVSGLDTGARTFSLVLEGGISLDISYTGTLEAGIVAGSTVKVEFSSAPVAGALSTTADKIESKHQLSADDGDRVEAEGVVSDFDDSGSPVTFTVDGIAVSASAGLLAGVGDGTEVEVKGTLVSGVLVALEVDIEHAADMDVEGTVVSVNTAGGSFVITDGTPTTIHVNSSTIFKDDRDTPVELFGLDDFLADDLLEVEYYEDTVPGQYIAVKIERHEP